MMLYRWTRSEALAWGHEWRWGYDKHPPLSAWAAEIASVVSGGSDVGLYALSALCTAGGLVVMWVLGRELLGERRALLSVVLVEGVYYFNFTSPEFNVNVLQFPLWALAILGYWRGVRTGKMRWWVLLGVCAGLALLSKYLAGAMLVAMAVHTLGFERRVLRTVGPYLAGVICVGLFVPHAVWLVEHEFISLTYGVRRAGGDSHEWMNHLVHPAKFVVAQLGAVGALIWLLLVWKPTRRKDEDEREARVFLFIMTAGPIGTLVALSVATGFELRSMWATPMLVTTGACAMAFFDVGFPWVKRRDGLIWIGVILIVPVMIYAAGSLFTLQMRDKPKRVNYPGVALGAETTRVWRERFGTALPVVVGNEWDAGLIGWYSPDRPTVYIGAEPTRAQWLDDEMVSRSGGLIVWIKAIDADAKEQIPMPYEADRFGDVEFLPDVVLAYPSAPDKAGVRFGLALIPPSG